MLMGTRQSVVMDCPCGDGSAAGFHFSSHMKALFIYSFAFDSYMDHLKADLKTKVFLFQDEFTFYR